VFYNGKEEMPDTIELKLSEAFKDAYTKEVLELTLTVYNINPGHNENIRKRSKALYEYSTIVAKVHENEKSGMSLAEALDAGVKYAKKHGVMSEFMEAHASEVLNMLLGEYDPVEARKVAAEEGYEDGFEMGVKHGVEKGLADGLEKGIEQGIEKGIKQGIGQSIFEIALRMKHNGRSTEDIIADTGITADQLERL
jgi:flagellar biosynthesis/type III secretory pathway protein FliH